MSNAYLTKAFASTSTGIARLVLIALADSADDEGRCHPGQRFLRVKTGLSISAIRKAIAELLAENHLECDRGYNSSNTYIVKPQIDPDSWAILTEKMEWAKKDDLLNRIGENQKVWKKSKTNSKITEKEPVIHNMDHLDEQAVIHNMDHSDPQYGSECSTIEISVIHNMDTIPNVSPINPLRNPNSDAAPKAKRKPKTEVLSLVDKPESVSDQIWSDYLAIRFAKAKSPLTSTALSILKNEAAKAEVSLETALLTCVENAWRGFKAEWYANVSRASTKSPLGGNPNARIDAGMEAVRRAKAMMMGEDL